jgi:hypothetical protein
MATLSFRDGTEVDFPAELVEYSDLLSEVRETFPGNDEPIEMVCGSADEARRSVAAFETIVGILPDIAKFNAPEGTRIEELEELRLRLGDAHAEIVELTRGNEVYEWLALSGDAARELRTLEDAVFPFPHLRDESLVEFVGDDISMTFARMCQDGLLPVARWLHSLGADIHAYDELAFWYACKEANLHVAQWLHSLGVDNHVGNDLAFQWACRSGHLLMAQWLHSLGGVDIHAQTDYAFRQACAEGHLHVAQWLHSLGGVDVHAVRDFAFRSASYNNHTTVADWLRELGCGD